MTHSRKILTLGFALVLALIAVTTVLVREYGSTSAAGVGTMRLTLADKAGCDSMSNPTKCTLNPGQAFTVQVVVDAFPAPGYVGIQAYIEHGNGLIFKKPMGFPAASIVWPDLESATAVGVQADDDGNTTNDRVMAGGLSGLIVQPDSTFTGVAFSFPFNCSASAGTHTLALRMLDDPAITQPTLGSGFKQSAAQAGKGVPASDTLTINCGAGMPPTATPTNTTVAGPTATPTNTTAGPTATPTNTTSGPTPTPTNTTVVNTPTNTVPAPPTATRTPTTPGEKLIGDVDDDGDVDAIDALWVLWVDAHLANEDDLTNGDSADVNGDGIIDSIDALFILWIQADLYEP